MVENMSSKSLQPVFQRVSMAYLLLGGVECWFAARAQTSTSSQSGSSPMKPSLLGTLAAGGPARVPHRLVRCLHRNHPKFAVKGARDGNFAGAWVAPRGVHRG